LILRKSIRILREADPAPAESDIERIPRSRPAARDQATDVSYRRLCGIKLQMLAIEDFAGSSNQICF
jgi:hypothetical protein